MRNFMSRHREEPRPEEHYLSYYDVCLTVEDINCLKNDWLTDNNISFYEEYLEHVTLSEYPNSRIILLRPSIVYLILNTPDPATIETALPPLRNATHIFLPINDNPNPGVAEGGSHWSLLVIGVKDGVAFHYDSLMDGNSHVAMEVTKKLRQLLKRQLQYYTLPDTPQQENSSDCGVHVCLTMKTLLVNRLLKASASENVDMSMGGKRQDATQGRKDMLKLIEKLRSRALRAGSPDGKENSPPRIAD